MSLVVGVKLASWAIPVVLAYLLILLRRPNRRLYAGLLLATAWNAWAILLVNLVALRSGWWSFAPELSSFMGVALEPLVGWCVLWGVVAPLAAIDRPLHLSVLAFLWLDLIVMPALEPVVVLHESWIWGEALALGVALVPGLLLARWTHEKSRLNGRVALQVVCAGAILLVLVPLAALDGTNGWPTAFGLPSWIVGASLQLLLVPIALGARAAVEFAQRGQGTPLPYDPPQRLVSSGPYSYVANPMQVSIVLYFALLAVPLRSVWMAAAAVVAVCYSSGLARWHEEIDLLDRFGHEWTRYRAGVRPWVPRLRPAVPSGSTLLIAYSCETCSSIGRWFLARRPVGLRIAPAEDSDHPAIQRVTYVPPDGPASRGVAGIARALEHIHLGWALVGWILALPGVVHLAQAIADVCGPGPQRVGGMAYDKAACSIDAVSR